MPFFVGDYLSSGWVRQLSLEERGAYIELLCFQWQEGDLPELPEKLARLLGEDPRKFRRLWAKLEVKFPLDAEGGRKNIKLESVRNGYIHKRKQRSEAGKASAAAREVSLSVRSNARATPILNQTNPIEKDKKYIVSLALKKRDELFDEMWKLFPGAKQGKKKSHRHFKAQVKTENDESDIRKALANYKLHLERNRWKNSQNASTWFNNYRDWVDWQEWMDEQKQDNSRSGNLTIPPITRPTLIEGPHTHFCGWCEQEKEPHQWECTDENCGLSEDCACVEYRSRRPKQHTLKDLQ